MNHNTQQEVPLPVSFSLDWDDLKAFSELIFYFDQKDNNALPIT